MRVGHTVSGLIHKIQSEYAPAQLPDWDIGASSDWKLFAPDSFHSETFRVYSDRITNLPLLAAVNFPDPARPRRVAHPSFRSRLLPIYALPNALIRLPHLELLTIPRRAHLT